jgi:hypothetical protein
MYKSNFFYSEKKNELNIIKYYKKFKNKNQRNNNIYIHMEYLKINSQYQYYYYITDNIYILLKYCKFELI